MFKKGETLTVENTSEDPNWWLASNAQGKRGMIPANYVVRLYLFVRVYARMYCFMHSRVMRAKFLREHLSHHNHIHDIALLRAFFPSFTALLHRVLVCCGPMGGTQMHTFSLRCMHSLHSNA